MSKVKAAGTAWAPPRPKGRSVPLAGVAPLAASFLVGCGSSDEPTGDNVDNVSPTAAASSDGLQGGDPIFDTPSDGDTSNTSNGVVNYVDNRNGVQAFGTVNFGAITTGAPDHIPYGTKLIVTCYAPNNTGEFGSVNGLYRIKGGKWDGTFVPANVMLNDPDAQVGDTDTPSIDPRLKDVACK